MTTTEREGLSTWVREHCTECDGTGRCGLHYDSTCMQCLGTGRRIRSILSPESAIPSATVPKGAPFDEQLPPLTEERSAPWNSSTSYAASSGAPETDTEAPARRPEQGPLHSVDDFRSELAKLRVERDEWLLTSAAWERERWDLTRERDQARADQREADANEEITQTILERIRAQLGEAKHEAELAREFAKSAMCERCNLIVAQLGKDGHVYDAECLCLELSTAVSEERSLRERLKDAYDDLDAFGLRVAERVAAAKHRCPRCSEVLLEPDLPGLVVAAREGR